MQFKFIAPVAGLLLLSSTGGCTPTPPEEGVCVANNCFRALRRFSTEAIPFCAEFIAIPKETVTVTTVTPTVTATITQYVQYPNIDKREDLEGIAVVHDGSVVFGLAPEAGAIAKRDALALPSYVSQYSEEEVSSACSCMSITRPIESTTATAPPTTTTITTTVGTDYRGKCDKTYKVWGNGSGNEVELFLELSEWQCCQKCQKRSDCVASAHILLFCQLLVNKKKVYGEEITKQCPLGVEDFHFGSPDARGIVYAGPCGV